MPEELQIRVHGDPKLPVLIYLPGLHGDWTLIGSFRAALDKDVCLVEFTYPRTLDWSLEQYAAEIGSLLVESGIYHGWILAESFGSQIVWSMMANQGVSHFVVDGIILSGGFVKHPNKLGLCLARGLLGDFAFPYLKRLFSIYTGYARFRHRCAPETFADIGDFIQRRTLMDFRAMKHRLNLLSNSDLRHIARHVKIPVYALSGFWDPIVPRLWTQFWLKRNCPGYDGSHTIFQADHNVLGTSPKAAARIVEKWIKSRVEGIQSGLSFP